MEIIKETSCGIIPLREKDQQWEVFLALHRNGSFWGFPKGHKDQDENPTQTAKRELKEETGLDVIEMLDLPPLYENYRFLRDDKIIAKQVIFYLGRAKGKILFQKEEIIDGKWMDLDTLVDIISFPEGKKLAIDLMDMLENLMNIS